MPSDQSRLPAQPQSLVEDNGVTWVQDYDHIFIETIENQVRPALADFIGSKISLVAFTPPAEPVESIRLLELRFNKDGSHASLGVGFPASVSESRDEFDIEHWKLDRQSAYGGGIVAGSFDEAWQIVCAVIRAMNGVSLTIGHGV